MKQACSMLSSASASGSCSAICGELLSAVRCYGRKAIALLAVFFLAFSVPVSAVVISPVSGVISLEPDTFGIRKNSLTENTDFGFSGVPASFELTDDTYRFSWQKLTAFTGFYSTVTESGKELTFIINVGNGDGTVDVSFDSLLAKPLFRCLFADDSSQLVDFTFTGYFEFGYDGNPVIQDELTDEVMPTVRNWSGAVSRYIYITVETTMDSVNVYDIDDATSIYQYLAISTNGFMLNNTPSELDEITVSIKNIEQDVDSIKGTVEDIQGDLSDLNDTVTSIDTTVKNIDNGVAKIDGTLTDMSEQLQTPDSNIWQSGATVIKDSVKELFVPPEEELTALKDDLELTMASKVGPLMEAVVIGDEYVREIVGIMSDPAFEDLAFPFPGISLPFNGHEFVILPPQDISIDNELVLFLQELLSIIVSGICFFSIIHIYEDAIYCLFSGVSFWGFIRSRHDK